MMSVICLCCCFEVVVAVVVVATAAVAAATTAAAAAAAAVGLPFKVLIVIKARGTKNALFTLYAYYIYTIIFFHHKIRAAPFT